MKALKILSIIFASITLLISIAPIMRDSSLATKVDKQLKEAGETAASQEQINEAMKKANLPSSGILYAAMTIAIFIALASIIGIFLTAKNNPKIKLIGLSIVVLAIASMIIHPSVNLGMFGGASPKTVAMLQGVPAILTGLFMFLFSTKIKAAIN